MLYELRDHQKQALNELRASFSEGKKRPMLYASVGYGKTVVAAHIVTGTLDKGKKVLFVAPYTALINQTARSFMDQGIPQPGIMQADHPWTNPGKRLQIASVQTLARRSVPDVDLVIVDEAHLQYSVICKLMEETSIPVIGLSGSPFSKGLGKYYDNLIHTTSMRQLIDQGFLSDYVAYSHDKPNLTGIKTVAGDYHEGQLGERMSDPKLIGCIIDTWLKNGENRPTICFCVNVAHAEFVGAEFEKVNITNVVITGRTPMEDREIYFTQFKKGNIKVLVNVGTLVAGFDSDVRCIIDAAPTKSDIRHVQKLGRGLRTAKGKDHLIILDHAGNLVNLGFPDDIEIDKLDTGNKKEAAERKEKQTKEKKEKEPKECSKCHHMKRADEHECSKCGFTPKFIENVEVADGELAAIKTSNKYTKNDKQRIYSELKGYQRERALCGKDLTDGWVSNTYKDMVGVWPRGLRETPAQPGEQVRGFIKHKAIVWAKSKNKMKSTAKHQQWLESRQNIA
ncbi:MAG: DEAD/DEAH box helicase [Aliivibrio sp.]|nr:DEAD/DEAH box helicase [Aliivibrio sp.]